MKLLVSLLLLSCFFGNLVYSLPTCISSIGGQPFYLAPGLCAWEFTSGLTRPRQMHVVSNGDVLVEQNGVISVLWDSNGDGISSSSERAVLTPTGLGLNHAVTVNGGYLYASSASTVYRWPYTPGTRTNLGTGQKVIGSMPTGGHSTRTLIFDSNNVLYISIGSNANIDPNSSRSRVVKCPGLNFNTAPTNGYNWNTDCVVHADGVRNEVGLRFDGQGRLWGVENGADNVNRSDIGVPNQKDRNPCEEVNLLDQSGAFYGYPYCFSEGYLPPPVGLGAKSQWAMPSLIKTDAWCRTVTNNIPPKFCMESHTAPLDLIFHSTSTFPNPFKSGIFVAQHGSWNRTPPSGYQVININTDPVTGMPIDGSSTKLFGVAVDGNSWSARPASVQKLSPCADRSECLLVSSDSNGRIYAVAAL
eukprot:gene6709-8310_t